VTVIGAEAFALCISLESVHIPESVTVIGICAFNEKTVVYFDRAEDVSLGWNSGYINNCLRKNRAIKDRFGNVYEIQFEKDVS
jgi:hypothetical protein